MFRTLYNYNQGYLFVFTYLILLRAIVLCPQVSLLLFLFYFYFIFLKKSLLTPMGDLCLSQSQVLCQRPRSSRVLCSILAVPNHALFWTESYDVAPGMCWSPSPRLEITVPSAPTSTGAPLAFTFHILSSVSFKSWYFSSFSSSFFLRLLSLDTTTSNRSVVFCPCLWHSV